MVFFLAKLQDMEINESDDNDEEKDDESESEEPDKQMGDVEENHPTNEVNIRRFIYIQSRNWWWAVCSPFTLRT